MRKFLGTTALAVLASTLFAGVASAETENPFRCKPGEKYVMIKGCILLAAVSIDHFLHKRKAV